MATGKEYRLREFVTAIASATMEPISPIPTRRNPPAQWESGALVYKAKVPGNTKPIAGRHHGSGISQTGELGNLSIDTTFECIADDE